MKNKLVTGHLPAIITILIWGTTFVASKILLDVYSPIEVLFMRFILGYAALGLASVPELLSSKSKSKSQSQSKSQSTQNLSPTSAGSQLTQNPNSSGAGPQVAQTPNSSGAGPSPSPIPIPSPSPKFSWKQEIYFAAAGLMGVTVYFLMENTALLYSTASNVGILVAVSPLFAAILSGLFLREEKLGHRFYIGFGVAMAGIVLVSLNGNFVLKLNPAGDLLAVAAAFAWAVYSILQKKIQPFGYSVVALTRKCFFYGLVFMVPFMIGMGFHPDMTALMKPSILFPVLYLGLGASAICYATWNFALHALGPVKVSVYIYLIPFVGIVFAAIILHEKITWAALAGVGLILAGLYLSENSFGKAKTGAEPAPVPVENEDSSDLL